MGDFLQNNWFWIVVLVFFVWMHASGMGCGGHGGHKGHGGRKNKPDEDQPQ
jgi:hypothetical protein